MCSSDLYPADTTGTGEGADWVLDFDLVHEVQVVHEVHEIPVDGGYGCPGCYPTETWNYDANYVPGEGTVSEGVDSLDTRVGSDAAGHDLVEFLDSNGHATAVLQIGEDHHLDIQPPPSEYVTQPEAVTPYSPEHDPSAESDSPHDITVDLPNHPIHAGPATIDTNHDGVPDSAVLEDGDHRVVVTDLNSDDVADRVLIIQDISSSDPSSIEMERSSNGEWIVNPGSSESSSSGTFEIPSQFLPALSPDAPLQQQIAERFDLEFAKNAAALWQAAYPGQPWPSDDITGEPYAPVVLVGVVAHEIGRAHV